MLFALALAVACLCATAANYFQGVSPTSLPWPGGVVPYQFDPSFTNQQQQAVYLDGMREWELAANVKFIPYTGQPNFVILRFDFNQGTNTYVSGNPAVMTIDHLSRAQICHETGHLLGFQHEHVRTDRDSFITVDFANIQSGSGEGSSIASLYLIDSNSTAFGAYDFESVMHYSKSLFAVDTNIDVIDPLPAFAPHYFNRIGNLCLSPLDRAGAVHLYGAPTTPLSNIVTNTADAGLGSLRAAIYFANDHPGTTIHFNIPNTDPGFSNGVYTIYLTGELPPQVGIGTIIDATTQSGFAGKPIVAIDGSKVLAEAGGSSGIYFYESQCVIRGLVIQNMAFSPVQMLYNFCFSNHVEGCYLGVTASGSNAAPSGFEGVNIAGGANGNVIGGTNAGQRNVLSGNSLSYGVTVTGTNTSNNIVEGNYFGLDATGTFAVPNFKSGVGIFQGAKNTVVGGTNSGAGNVLSGNTEYGVFIGDPDTTGTIVQGNFIGTDATGNHAVPNLLGGIAIFNEAHGVMVGGTSTNARNVISGNTTVGVYMLGDGASNNVVQGNFIGLNSAGSAAVPNTFTGIYLLDGAQDNTIGGTAPGSGNIISGNASEGIYISDPGTENNFVFGNRIGTDAAGANAVPNGFTGVGIWSGAQNNSVGGTGVAMGNLISGSGNGVTMGFTNTTGNIVQGNLIGTTTNGLAALPNTGNGVYIRDGASQNLVGGNIPAARNIISGNTGNGVLLAAPETSGNQVLNNYIGLNINGNAAIPNQSFGGVALEDGATGNFIGTPDPATRNFISGNLNAGVYISDPGTASNIVQGNSIGFAGDGVTALGNSGQGIRFQGGVTNNIVGLDLTGAGMGNIIANSGFEGVIVFDTPTVGNTIRGNAIFNNGKLGINLAGGTEDGFGVTANDLKDPDTGPNNLQNFPVITAASVSGGETYVAGTLNSTPNRSFLIDLYRNQTADPSGHGEGQVYLGSAGVNTDGNGNGTFVFNAPGSFAGQAIAATATDMT